MRHRIVWADQAIEDLSEIVSFIAQERPLTARTLARALRAKVATLKSTPMRCRIIPELADWEIREYLELIHPPYRLIFRIVGAEVRILAVIDARRDFEQAWEARLRRF